MRRKTATVMGKVYYTPQINYILWGRINRLLSEDKITLMAPNFGASTVKFVVITENKAINTVRSYREKKQYLDIYGVEGPVEWAKVGWNWGGKFTEAPNESVPFAPNPRKYIGALQFLAGASIGDRDSQRDAILDVLIGTED
jgi:hypothetical protein